MEYVMFVNEEFMEDWEDAISLLDFEGPIPRMWHYYPRRHGNLIEEISFFQKHGLYKVRKYRRQTDKFEVYYGTRLLLKASSLRSVIDFFTLIKAAPLSEPPSPGRLTLW